MRQRQRAAIVLGAALAAGALGLAVSAMAQGHAGHGAAAKDAASAPRPIPMEELHRSGGVPRGWKFTLPPGGDPAKGRRLFAELECYKCHAIEGAGFPASGGDGKTGPALTGMGAHHPAEYFAESIIAPDNVLLAGPGWIGPDGRSIMPSYADALTIVQLVDLVAFIKSQDGGGGGHAHHTSPAQERAVGPYRVRLVFKPTGDKAEGHDHAPAHHGAHAPHGGAAKAGTSGHLMVFVSDATSGEPVPYLPVSAGIQARGVASRTVKLMPMMGGDGFHYGADATLPPGTQKIVLSIGATTMQVAGAERGRFARPQTVAFDWSPPAK